MHKAAAADRLVPLCEVVEIFEDFLLHCPASCETHRTLADSRWGAGIKHPAKPQRIVTEYCNQFINQIGHMSGQLLFNVRAKIGFGFYRKQLQLDSAKAGTPCDLFFHGVAGPERHRYKLPDNALLDS